MLERGERKKGKKRGKVRSWKNEVSVYERKKRKWKRDKCCNWETSPISDGRLLIKFKSSSLCKKENHEIFFENERNKNQQSKEKERGNIFFLKKEEKLKSREKRNNLQKCQMREKPNFTWEFPRNWIVDKRPEKYSNKRKEIKKTRKKRKKKRKKKRREKEK